jgi:hypothetical protein
MVNSMEQMNNGSAHPSFPLSPIPIPDQTVFNVEQFYSDRRKKIADYTKYRCPSPPSKSPPVSRLAQKNGLNANAQVIAVHTPANTNFATKIQPKCKTSILDFYGLLTKFLV